MLAAASTIRAEEAARHVEALADDAFEGREGGTRGGRAAGAYIVEQIEHLGFEAVGDEGSFYQAFGGGLRNLLALLPGRDPTLAREVVVIGAHYDHVGYGNAANSFGPFGHVHNGADDNASGVAGLIEVMEALVRLPERPRRSILVAFWDGEEKGLLGSQHFLRVRPDRLAGMPIVFSVNLDMIGRLRDERLTVYGCRTAAGLRSTLVGVNNDPACRPGLEFAFDWDVLEDSDHYPFIAADVPTVMLHTGLHDQYHRPSDDVEHVVYEGIPRVAKLTLALATAVADADEAPTFRPECRSESNATRRRLEGRMAIRNGFKGRWGIVSRVDPGEPSTPITIQVVPGSAAAKAGLLAGDRVVAVQGKRVADQADMIARLAASEGDVDLTIDRRGRILALRLGDPTVDR